MSTPNFKLRTWVIGLAVAGAAWGAFAITRADASDGPLAQQIQNAKAHNPAAFDAVADVKGHRPETYKEFRNPIPMVGRELRHLGPDALLPMLEKLDTGEAPAGSTVAEADALTIGMLEAVSALRDPRSVPVARKVFERRADHLAISKMAAEVIGHVCDDASLDYLVAALDGPQRVAAINGLGHCRRGEAADALLSALENTTDEVEATDIAKALGVLGSSWAWKSLGPEQDAVGVGIRERIATGLVKSMARLDGKVCRNAHAMGLGMVAHPKTDALVAQHASDLDAVSKAHLSRISARISR